MNLAKVEGDEIVIRIAVSALPDCALYGWDNRYGFGNHKLQVTDLNEFKKEFVLELNREKENGDTILHEAFDIAVVRATENGCFGIDEVKEGNDDDMVR